MKNKTALVAGATGLVGGELVKLLVDSKQYQKIYLLTRRNANIMGDDIEQIIVKFDDLQANDIPQVDDVFCCLGTTIGKAGSKEAFKKVDHDYPLTIAKLCLQKGARQLLLVTAMGADKSSRFFYNQVKGEVEEAVAALGYPTLHVFRPSLLIGDREGNRTGEDIAKAIAPIFSPLLIGGLKKYRPVEGKTVAEAMAVAAQQALQGPHIFDSQQIKILAREHPGLT